MSASPTRREFERFHQFVADCCDLGSRLEVGKTALREAYKQWAEEKGERRPLNEREFYESVRTRLDVDEDRTNQYRLWRGIGLRCETVTPVTRSMSLVSDVSRDGPIRLDDYRTQSTIERPESLIQVPKLDEDYEIRDDDRKLLDGVMRLAETEPVIKLLLVGEPGVGKTSLAQWIAARMTLGLYYQNCPAVRDATAWFGKRSWVSGDERHDDWQQFRLLQRAGEPRTQSWAKRRTRPR
jgi:hypothetical protein